MNFALSDKRKFYKGKYFIVFYNKTDDELLYLFDNVRDILTFMNKPINRKNVNLINVLICRALKSEYHFVKFLTGEVMRVYIIDREEDDYE